MHGETIDDTLCCDAVTSLARQLGIHLTVTSTVTSRRRAIAQLFSQMSRTMFQRGIPGPNQENGDGIPVT